MQVISFRVRYFSKSRFQPGYQSGCQNMDSSSEGDSTSFTDSELLDESNGGSGHHNEILQEYSDSEDEDGQVITPLEVLRVIEKDSFNNLSDKEKEKARRSMADELIKAALDEPDEEEDGIVPEEKQRSLRVGIIGAVNAGKSSLTNFMVCSL
mgnify:FL=1